MELLPIHTEPLDNEVAQGPRSPGHPKDQQLEQPGGPPPHHSQSVVGEDWFPSQVSKPGRAGTGREEGLEKDISPGIHCGSCEAGEGTQNPMKEKMGVCCKKCIFVDVGTDFF